MLGKRTQRVEIIPYWCDEESQGAAGGRNLWAYAQPHWRVFRGRESPTYQPRAKSIPRAEKTALAAITTQQSALQ